MAMFTDTPTATTVDTPMLRSTGSSSVPPMGPKPCTRDRTRSVRSTPISGTTSVAGLPSSIPTLDCFMAANRRALRFPPRPSPRWKAVACTTWTPARRAARTILATLGMSLALRAAAASSGRAEESPMTPRCTSDVTTAVWCGATSSARSRAIRSVLDGQAAVDRDDGARHVVAVVGCEEGDDLGHLLGLHETHRCHERGHEPLRRVGRRGELAHHRCVDAPGGDGVHPYAALQILDGQ